jgi:transposase
MPFLDAQRRAEAIDCFRAGMSQRETARRLRLSFHTLQGWLTTGAKASSGWQRQFLLDVEAAQAEHQKLILQGLMSQTQAGGSVAAVQLALQRLDRTRKEQEEEAIPEDELGAKLHRLRDVRRRIVDAGDTAYTKLVREERELLADIERLRTEAEKDRKALASLRALERVPAMERLRSRVGQLQDGDLRDLQQACAAELAERGLDERGA